MTLACDLGALGAARARYAELREFLAREVREVTELADGYALRLPGTDEALLRVAEWITLERRCCPFLDFAVEWGHDRADVVVKLTGEDGVKSVIGGMAGRVPS